LTPDKIRIFNYLLVISGGAFNVLLISYQHEKPTGSDRQRQAAAGSGRQRH
jgi:hypothetical protein